MDRAGRGGLRGRGGHQPPQIQTQPFNWAQQNGSFGNRGSQQSYSPPARQPFSSQYARPGGRGTARSQPQQPAVAYPTQSRMPTANGTPVAPHPQQGYPYDGVYTMSPAVPGMPYATSTFVEPMLIEGIRSQVEYWFSVDNLVKDHWLRRQMDSQGFVLLSTIASFRRMQAISKDIIIIRSALAESPFLDVVVGDDGLDRVRAKGHWVSWVLPASEREESCRNDGPTHIYVHARPQAMASQFPMDTMTAQYMTMSPGYFTPHNMGQGYQNFGGEGVPHVNGHANGADFVPESQLSAAVPAFSPRAAADGFGGFDGPSTFRPDQGLSQPFSPNGVNGQFPSKEYAVAGSATAHGGPNGTAHEQISPHPTTNGINGGHDAADAFASQGAGAFRG